MNSRSNEKKSDPKELEKVISPILVVSQSKLKPFIELFENYPENIMLQSLGTLLGFFKINDKSEDSAYIVNFLSSVIKKEYFINYKRPVGESLDAALHKTNLALAEVAKNGNIRWIGQLDAAICVLEKNILHFTVCGAAKILLLRNQMLSDISKDLNPEELEPNPLKTFSNVSSGYLEMGDKIIITSSELFNIFSLNELKKGSLRFDQEKFVQFLKTAMVNELDSASTIVIDINENLIKKEAKKTKVKEEEREVNPFDSKTFANPIISSKDTTPISNEDLEYTDEKTGHIYVQGDTNEVKASSFWSELMVTFKEKMVDFSYWLKNKGKRLRLSLKQFGIWLKEKFVSAKIGLIKKIKERRAAKKQEQEKEEAAQPVEKIILTEEIVEEKIGDETIITESESAEVIRTPQEPNKFLVWTKELWQRVRQSKWPAIFWNSLKIGFRKIMPAFSRIKKSFLRLNYHQRLYALLTLIVIIVAPILILKLRSPEKEPIQTEMAPQISERDILLQDKNIREVETALLPIVAPDLKKAIVLNDLVFSVSPKEISNLTESGVVDKFSLPENFGSFSLITSMEDLNLIFILSDKGQLISFSPVSKKFQDNTIALPGNSQLKGAGTYLTYLYLADSTSNQIYRYPRSTGGFGDKTDWLKDSFDFSNITDMAIEENLYLAKNNEIVKFFQGKKVDFNPDPTTVPLSISKLFTGRKISNLYVLDSKNGRVVKFTKDGLLQNQYYNEKLKGATSFAVDEKTNKVYFVNLEGLSSFSM